LGPGETAACQCGARLAHAAAGPRNDRKAAEFPLRIKCRGVEMRFAIDAPDPGVTNPDPVLLKQIKRGPPLL